MATSAPRKTKTHPSNIEGLRHAELQLLKGEPDLKPEAKDRPPTALKFKGENLDMKGCRTRKLAAMRQDDVFRSGR